jgi:hypothetical protein
MVLSGFISTIFSGNALWLIVGDRFFFLNHFLCASAIKNVATLFLKFFEVFFFKLFLTVVVS